MRKILLFIVFCFSYFSALSQIRFQVRDICADTLLSTTTVDSYVWDDDKNYYYPNECGYYYLKSGTEYHVLLLAKGKKTTMWEKEFSYFVADLEAKDVVVDMYRIDKYHYFADLGQSSFAYWWYNCDELCDGRLVDYYENGNIRLKGKFKKGQAVGKIYFYNEDGTLDKIEKYSRLRSNPKYGLHYYKDDGTRDYYRTSKLLRTIKKGK